MNSIDPLKRLNILLLSGVLQHVSVAAALGLTMDEFARVCLRQRTLSRAEESEIAELVDQYGLAMNDVNVRLTKRSPNAI